MIKWEASKNILELQFHFIGDEEVQRSQWHYCRQRQGHSVQQYNREFEKLFIQVGFFPKNLTMVIEYLAGLYSGIRGQGILFNPKTLNKVCVQTYYVDDNKKKALQNGSKLLEQWETSTKCENKGGCKMIVTNTHVLKDPKNPCEHCNIDDLLTKHCIQH